MEFTKLGTAIAPGIGTGIGAALDIGSLIATGIGEKRQADLENEQWEKMYALKLREAGMNEAEISAKLDEMREKKRKREQFSQLLGKALGKAV